MAVITYQRFWQRRDTEANWTAANSLLAPGELGVVTDAGDPAPFKIGNGVTLWNSLPYQAAPISVLAGGTANALTATFDPVPVLYDGLTIGLRAAAANTTAATLAVNGGTARAITVTGGTALTGGEIAAAGHELLLRYRASVPRWELLNPAGATVANDSITNAKLANMAVSTIKARKTAGTGDPEDCSLSEVLDFIGSAAQGDILYRGASGWARLPAATAGYLLSTNGTGANPSYIAPGAASVGAGAQIGYARTQSATAVSTASTTLPIDNTIPQNTEGAAYTNIDVTYTPQFATSKLRVRVHLPWVSNTNSGLVFTAFAIFRDAGANAVYATLACVSAANGGFPVDFEVEVAAGSTSATTFTIRWGTSGGTSYINRNTASNPLFGGVQLACMEVTEIKQ